ncbi:anaphase-promoting complex subunit 1 isoform X1 [Schistocerca gregaria]|uniref:anaphase-promoting complex subunit 1 isoform X1 n=1 Tax=Schistocerca gregaria TaxID=7010 RepID=UPI00211E4753|nr:anaphase-promoting complex subunit 1 isoform X1 [Schistocerca gregaria]
MIAASEPLEFVPFGRHHLQRHPGDVVVEAINRQHHPDSSLLHRLSQVAISEDTKNRENWRIRASLDDDQQCEEELYMNGKIAVWSQGSMSSHRNPNSSKVIKSSYTSETPLQAAIWCTFHVSSSDKPILSWTAGRAPTEEPEGAPTPAVCLIDAENIKVYTEDGEDYVSSLQFEVSAAWPCKYGLLLERATNVSAPHFDYEFDENPPTIFSLSHPLDDVTPVVSKHVTLSNICDPCQKIVFVSEEPSVCMTYDSNCGLHSVWKIRKVQSEECRFFYPDQSNTTLNHSNASTFMGNASVISNSNRLSIGATRISAPVTTAASLSVANVTGGLGSVSGIASCRGSPVLPSSARTSASSFSPLGNRAASPGEAFALLSPASSCRSVRRPSGSPLSLADSRLTVSQATDYHVIPKPLYPELCIEHVWTEKSREGIACAASHAFLVTDMVGQMYLCYMLPARKHLMCMRLELTHEQQLIFGVACAIQAKDAAPLPKINMIATIDLSGGVVLYTGLNMVAKVHIGGIPSALTTSSYLSSHLSPFPRRSSAIWSPSGSDSLLDTPKFEEAVRQLSPVAPPPAPPVSPNEKVPFSSSYLEGSPQAGGQLVHIRDPVANRITLEYADGSLFRMALPELCTSPLVMNCLKVLKNVLQKDVAMQLLVRWYASRNAPGSQDIAPQQEWQLFLGVLLDMIGYDVEQVPVMRAQRDGPDSTGSDGFHHLQQHAKKRRSSDMGSSEDWEYLLRSDHHRTLAASVTTMLGLHPPPPPSSEKSHESATPTNSSASLFLSLPLLHYALHLLYEDLKLNMLMSEVLPSLAQLLYQLSSDLKLPAYVDHYWRDYPTLCPAKVLKESYILDSDLSKLQFPHFIPQMPPDVFHHIYNMIMGRPTEPFPYIRQVNRRTKDIVQLVAVITQGAENPNLQLEHFIQPVVPAGIRGETQEVLSARDAGRSASYPFPHRAVLLMVEMDITAGDLQQMPVGVAMLLSEVIYLSRQNPPSDWPETAYRLIARQDLVAQCSPNSMVDIGHSRRTSTASAHGSLRVPPLDLDTDDGMEMSDTEQTLKLRFSKDHRVAEVRRLLQSSQPVRIAIPQQPEVSDHEYIEEQEKHLYALCTRTMALPVGRGMFTLRTAAPIITETLSIPRLCLTGRAAPRGTTVDLSHIDVVPNMNMWPLFHNGVAAGLRIAPNASDIESAWIVFNKPKGTSEAYTEHAGFLMALGLNGNLMSLARLNMYEYLVKCHELTSVGLLLGVAATKRGTMDVATTKMMSVHMEALLPPTSIELDIQQNIQVAALLGIGLLYEGTAHRRMAEVLLSEIGRPPGPEMENSDDRESYSLAAGLALGLVVLCQGQELDGLNDLAIPDRLHHYMVGGHRRPLTGSQKEKYKSPSYQIREGDAVNIDVTSPGATLALGMMFFNTGNRAVADWMKAPDTQYLLDFVRPDFLLLRIVSRSLILWDSILPTVEWVESNVPESIRPCCLVKPPRILPQNIDYETMNQAYCNIVAGGCMAVGLRFAGSANNEAFKTLLHYAKMFTNLSGKSIAELAGKSTIETCLNVMLLSLAMVMAGTGDLDVLRLVRHLRSRVGPANSVVTYGSHLATHMALGLLFLGGGRYTLSTSPSAVAAMLCAFFPKFPTHSNDNRYHLQAFRHLYVLAVEPRLLMPRDIDQGTLCYAHVNVVYLDTIHYQGQSVRLRAPCMLPELSLLKEVRVEDDRYWSVTFHRDKNWDNLRKILQGSGVLNVKQRAGCLSYLEDPQGFRSLLAQTLTTDTAVSWSVRADSVNAFSSDPNVAKFAQCFLENEELETSMCERQIIQLLATVVYECVTQDKLSILPMWLTIIKTVQSMATEPNHLLMWQLKLVTAQGISRASWRQGQSVLPLVSSDMALSVIQRVLQILDSWETDLSLPLKAYLKGELCCRTETALRLTMYLTYHEIPYYGKFEALEAANVADPLSMNLKLQQYRIPPRTLQMISSIFATENMLL